jgi:hypothetical protein
MQELHGPGQRDGLVCRILLELIDSTIGRFEKFRRGYPASNQILGPLAGIFGVIPLDLWSKLACPLRPGGQGCAVRINQHAVVVKEQPARKKLQASRTFDSSPGFVLFRAQMLQ